ncbi:protein BatD [Leucothrix sargassi]|nr:protein BatD [Leucothrix sargassi]
MVKRLLFIALVLGLSSSLFAKGFTARVDRLSIGLGEQLQLVLQLEDAQGSRPDISSLENDFTILKRSQSSNVRVINGIVSQEIRWSYLLSPRRKGTLTIPSFVSGNLKSEAIEIEVGDMPVAQSTTDEVILEVEVAPLNPYVKGQVIYTQRLYFAQRLVSNASLDKPKLETGEAEIIQIGSTNPKNVTRNNRIYSLIERYYVVIPKKAGELSFQPSVFRGSIADRRQQPHGFNMPMFDVGKRVTAYSSKASLKIAEQPASYTGDSWLPASHVELAMTWSQAPETLKAGEPVTVTTAVIADGLKAEVLPEIKFQWPGSIKTYPEKPEFRTDKTANGLLGLRQEKVVLVANENGDFTVPPVKVTWWNTVTNKQEVEEIAGFTMSVSGAATTAAPVEPPSQDVAKSEVVTEEEAPKESALAAPEVSEPLTARLSKYYAANKERVLSIAGGLLVALVLLYFAIRRVARPKTQQELDTKALNSAKQELLNACQRNDTKAAVEALPAWAQAVGIYPATLAGITEVGDQSLSEAIKALSQASYAKESQAWQGQALKTAVENYQQTTTSNQSEPTLGSLHPEF